MFGELLKRVLNVLVMLLAALTFFLVPVGNKTPAGHLAAIFATPPAREAGKAFAQTARTLFEKAQDRLGALRSPARDKDKEDKEEARVSAPRRAP